MFLDPKVWKGTYNYCEMKFCIKKLGFIYLCLNWNLDVDKLYIDDTQCVHYITTALPASTEPTQNSSFDHCHYHIQSLAVLCSTKGLSTLIVMKQNESKGAPTWLNIVRLTNAVTTSKGKAG